MGIGQGYRKKSKEKSIGNIKIVKIGLCCLYSIIILRNGQLGSYKLYLLVRTYAFDAHFSMEADICDPNLTPISICQNFVQNQNINIYPL